MEKSTIRILLQVLAVLSIIFMPSWGFGQSQNELLKNFNAASLIPGSHVNGKVEVKTKPWPITLTREGDNITRITLLRAGVLEEIYEPDVPGFPAYFYSIDNRICFINGVLIYYKLRYGKMEVSYVLGQSAADIAGLDVNKLTATTEEYLVKIKSSQSGAREELKADLVAQKESDRLANSIQGKPIKKLEIVWLTTSSETGMQSKIQYGVKATDDKGKIYQTDNLGGKTPWDDFEIISSGAIPGDEFLTVDTDGKKITNNTVYLTIKSKYHTGIEAKSSILLAYSTPVKLSYLGADGCPPLRSGTGTGGGSAPSAELTVCNSADGRFVLIEVKINSKIVHNVKLQNGVPFSLDIRGGPGCSGSSSQRESQGGKGGSGGNGGNIVVNRSSGLKGDNISIYNDGGRGGRGGKGTSFEGPSGSNGRNGQVINNVTSLILNF